MSQSLDPIDKNSWLNKNNIAKIKLLVCGERGQSDDTFFTLFTNKKHIDNYLIFVINYFICFI